MKQRKKPRALEYREILSAIFEFMLLDGMNRSMALRTAASALRLAEKTWSTPKPGSSSELVVAGLLLDAWHRNRRYVDGMARPKAIPLKGVAPSVAALARAQGISVSPTQLIQRMQLLRLVKKDSRGRFMPMSNVAVVSGPNISMKQHLIPSLLSLLGTVRHNVTAKKSSPNLIERRAEIPDLPANFIPEFQDFTQTQGAAFLNRVNDWLESRRARSIGKQRSVQVSAGVEVFSYLGVSDRAHQRKSSHD